MPALTQLSPTIVATLRAWERFVSHTFLGQDVKLLPLPISSLPLIIPGLSVAHWSVKGIKTVGDLLSGPTLKSFQALQGEFGLADTDSYRYLQISHFLKKSPQTSTALPWRAMLYFTNPTTNIKGISLFYNLLNNKNIFIKTSNMDTWERDIGATFSDDQWQSALRSTFSATKSVNLWELSHKILVRWYLTPYRLSKFDPKISSLCWRNCGEVGTLHHTLWSCPSLNQLWVRIFNLISQFAGARIIPSAGAALLSLGLESVPFSSRTIITHLLLSTRLSIARHWRDADPPSMSEVVETTNTHVSYELMFAASQGRMVNMERKWFRWNRWYNSVHKNWTDSCWTLLSLRFKEEQHFTL